MHTLAAGRPLPSQTTLALTRWLAVTMPLAAVRRADGYGRRQRGGSLTHTHTTPPGEGRWMGELSVGASSWWADRGNALFCILSCGKRAHTHTHTHTERPSSMYLLGFFVRLNKRSVEALEEQLSFHPTHMHTKIGEIRGCIAAAASQVPTHTNHNQT